MRGSVMRRAAVRHENPLLRRLIVARLPLLLVIAVVALTTAAAVPVIMVARLSHPHLRVAARHPTLYRAQFVTPVGGVLALGLIAAIGTGVPSMPTVLV